MKFNVVSTVALPEHAGNGRTKRHLGRKPTYPWPFMRPGDSFYARGVRVEKISVAAVLYGQAHGTRYTCRSTPQGVRVWRVA